MQKTITAIGDKNIEAMMGGTGCPTVVILPGMSSSMYEWELIYNQLCQLTTVVVVHRPGVGNSELGEESRTTYTTALDLKQFLDIHRMAEPILLIGHSYGGLCAQHFAKLFPNSVAGVMLVDSTSIHLQRLNQIPLSNHEDSDERWIEKCIHYSRLTPKQLAEEIKPQLESNQLTLSPSAQRNMILCQTNPNLYKAMASEINAWENCALTIKQAGEFPAVPLVVIGRDPEYSVRHTEEMTKEDAIAIENIWQDLILEQVTLNGNGKYILAEDAGHSIHLDRPDIIVKAVKNLLINL